jgi:hypothetical protein
MPKVTTSQGGIQSTETIESVGKKSRSAPALEMKAEVAAADPPEQKAEPKDVPRGTKTEDPDEHIDAEDRDLSDIAIKEAQDKARRKIGKYAQRWQTELKAREAAQEEALQNERFAETLFNERELFRRENEELKKRQPQVEKVPEVIAPDENDPKYKDASGNFMWKQFSTDNAAYEAKKAIAEDRKAQAEERKSAEKAANDALIAKNIADAEVKFPGWLKKIQASSVELQNEALAFIAQSQYFAEIGIYLAEHPVEAEKIKALHYTRAIAAISKIEAGFEKPVATAQTSTTPSKTVEHKGAPEPITPISTSGTGSVVLDPAKMDFKQLRAYEREKAMSKRH